jgi:nucleotide-binding universal stress UspA family protein
MKYLVPFDFSPVSKNAVKHALRLAGVSGGEIFLLHIVSEKEQLRAKEILFKEYISTLKTHEKYDMSHQIVVGDIFNDIGRISDYHGADLVIMGTHGVDMMQKIFGSNAIKIIKNATSPFIIVQEECDEKELKKIVMPFSIEKKSMQVLRFAAQLSKIYNTEIIMLGRNHTDEVFKHQENTNVLVAHKYLKEQGVAHRFEIVNVSKSDFQDFVIDFAQKEGADLIATTYFSDSLLPIFEKFIQNLIVNKHHIPVLCLNSQSLTKSDSIMSFMTN